MGSGLQAGAGRELNLHLRVVAAASAIVAVSLLVAGALTWVLVRDVEFKNAQDQLAHDAINYRTRVLRAECAARPAPTTVMQACPKVTLGGVSVTVAPVEQYEDDLRTISNDLAGDRLLLLDRQGHIVFDSADPHGVGSTAQLAAPAKLTRSVAGEQVPSGEVKIDGSDYFGAAVALAPARDPLHAARLVVGRPRAAVEAQATAQLLPRLMLAAGVSLIAAVALSLLISRALTRPLTELADAAEDIGRGNYARRVSISGNDEVGVTGRAFNRMAAAVEGARQTQREFLANVSHELKTPLTSLIGFSQALVDGSLPEESSRRRAATIIHEESERVLRMAQELLDLARVEGGHVSFHAQAVDLGALLSQELEIVRRRAEQRGLALELTTAEGLPPAQADPERLHQVLENLHDNAVKYAPDGTQVQVAAGTAGAGQVEVTVRNPVGPHPPDPERMFERFYRGDPSRSAAGGVGLGLAISRELATAMAGELTAAITEEGGGGRWLVMRLVLPAAARREGEPAPVQATVRLRRRPIEG